LGDAKKNTGNSHRGHLDIIADILEASLEGTRKTNLMYRCNMSFKQLKSYLEFLMAKKLLRVVAEDVDSYSGFLRITDKGKNFLRSYKGLKALVK
jgi:predicted transcriptional regulator